MLTRMGRGETPYEIENGDKVVFSASIIPEPTNEGQRYQSEQLLRMQGARLYDDIHVSGHLREEVTTRCWTRSSPSTSFRPTRR